MTDNPDSSGDAPKPPRRRFFAAAAAAIAGAGLLGRGKPAQAGTLGANPFIGEVMMFAGNFAPRGWLPCDGTLLPISQYDALFALLGTTYGGDGVTTFALPDLRSRNAIHAGSGPGLSPRYLGETAGNEEATLNAATLPVHSHATAGDASAGTSPDPAGKLPARDATGGLAWGSGPAVAMAAGHLAPVGSTAPHQNRAPYLAITYCIATEGVFPSPF